MTKRLFLFLVLSLLSLAALADAPITQYSYTIYPGNTTGWANSVGGAASGMMDYYNSNPSTSGGGQYSFSVASVGTSNYQYKKTCMTATSASGGPSCVVGTYTTSTNTPSTRLRCADGSAPNTALPLAQQCPTNCAPGVKSNVSMDYGVIPASGWQDASKTVPLPTSWNGCIVKAIEVLECNMYLSDAHTKCRYVVETTGSTAALGGTIPSSDSGSPGSAASSTPMPVAKAPDALGCPKGSVQAGMSSDGIPLCVGSGTTPNTAATATTTTKPETSVTNADGSSTKTQVTEIKNADGSTTTQTKTTTTGADGAVVVKVDSTTGNTPAGTPGKPGANGADGKDAKSLCDQHPELTACRNSTASGDCAAGMTYTGDAIQGATLQAAKAIQCKQQKDEDDLKASAAYAKGGAVLGGTDPDAASLPTMSNASSVAVPSSLDTSGFAGAGAPFADVSFSFRGQSFVLPLAKWSGYLEAFKYVMMVIASLVSFRILSGAILKD